jgi:hypothetical protein
MRLLLLIIILQVAATTFVRFHLLLPEDDFHIILSFKAPSTTTTHRC